MEPKTYVKCSRCGRVEEYYEAISQGWLIAPQRGKKPWVPVIRCPEHITAYALRQAGVRR